MSGLLADVRASARALRRRPGFAAASIATLALGIGAAVAVITVVYGVLLAPLPFPDDRRLALIFEPDPGGLSRTVGYPTFLDWREHTRSFSSMAAMAYWQPNLIADGQPERLEGRRVSSSFFRTLGVPMALGRDLADEEDRPDRRRVVVLTHSLFQRRFGGDPSLVGKSITLNESPHLVAGILPPGVSSPLDPGVEIFSPLGYDVSQGWACRTCRHLRVVGRLATGMSIEQASADVNAVTARLAAAFPKDYGGLGAVLRPVRDERTRDIRPALLALLGAVALLLLIAGANVGSLLLGRAGERRGEMAVRTALGAGRGRLVRQLLVESLAIALLGWAGGLALAAAGLSGFAALAPSGLQGFPGLSATGPFGPAVFVTTLTLSVAIGLGFGLVPALLATRAGSGSLPAGRATPRPGRLLARRLLVAADVALGLALLAGAGLLARSFTRLLAVDPGFSAASGSTGFTTVTMEVNASGAKYRTTEACVALYAAIADAAASQPGVTGAAVASQLPLRGDLDQSGLHAEDRPLANPELAPTGDRISISPGYLSVMGIPLVAGRAFTAADRADTLPVALVSRTAARRVWGDADPIGRRLRMGGPTSTAFTVVGIVGDVHHESLGAEPFPQVYVPHAQWGDDVMSLVVTGKGRPEDLAAAARAAVRSVDPTQPIARVATLHEVRAASLKPARLTSTLFALFAFAALVLAAVGTFGVVSGLVTERTREIGIRAALGADRRRLVSLVLGTALAPAALGLLAGLPLTLALGRAIGGLLFGVTPADPLTLAGAALLLALVSLAASVVPARRAAALDPVLSLRRE